MRAEHAVGENERRGAHSRNADSFSAKIGDRIDAAIFSGLDPQTTAMNSAGEFYIESLFDRLQKVHHEVMGDVESAQRQDVFVIGPLAFHQTGIEAFLFEKAVLDCAEDRRFAGKPNISDPDFVRGGGRARIPTAAARYNETGDQSQNDQLCS